MSHDYPPKRRETRSISDLSLTKMIWLLQRTYPSRNGRLHNAWTVVSSVTRRRDHRPPTSISLTQTFVNCDPACAQQTRCVASMKGAGCWLWPGLEWVMMRFATAALRGIFMNFVTKWNPSGIHGHPDWLHRRVPQKRTNKKTAT